MDTATVIGIDLGSSRSSVGFMSSSGPQIIFSAMDYTFFPSLVYWEGKYPTEV
jgi:molecular chaperone DnaK (HSP70)